MQFTLQIVFRPAHFFKTFPPEVRKINGDQVWQRDMVSKFNRRQIPPIFCPFASFQLNASVAQFIFMRMLISLFRLIYSSIILDASAQQIEASVPGDASIQGSTSLHNFIEMQESNRKNQQCLQIQLASFFSQSGVAAWGSLLWSLFE